MPVDHYENFPVASWLLPRHLQRPIEIIYAFARSADDLADEGSIANSERLALLEGYEHELHAIASGSVTSNPLFGDLAGPAERIAHHADDVVVVENGDLNGTRHVVLASALQRTSDGRLGSNFQSGIRNCMAIASSRAPAPILL